MKKKYFTEEERKAARRESKRKWREANPEYFRKYNQTPMGRASYLLNTYRAMDINKGFGDVIDFDAKWIVENIFTKKCAHCDCTDWHKLGCNRINNDLPHIKSNIEPCCWGHNLELAAKEQSIPIAQFDKNSGELVAVWPSSMEAARQLGYTHSNICNCCNGGYFDKRRNKWVNINQYNGFVWRRITKEEYETLRACLG